MALKALPEIKKSCWKTIKKKKKKRRKEGGRENVMINLFTSMGELMLNIL